MNHPTNDVSLTFLHNHVLYACKSGRVYAMSALCDWAECRSMLCCFILTRWGTTDAEIKVPSCENPQLSLVFPPEPGVRQTMTPARFVYCQKICLSSRISWLYPLHASPTARNSVYLVVISEYIPCTLRLLLESLSSRIFGIFPLPAA